MYIKEKDGDPEYPMRFLKVTQDHGVFNGTSKTQGIWVNSRDYINKFLDCFPTYPRDRTVYSQIGVNQLTFRPKGTTVAKDLEQHLRPEDKPKAKDVKKIVTFIGKFADWKRLDATLHAAALYEAEFPDVATIIVGSGPQEAIEEYEGLAKKLGLKRTFFVGPKGQPILADLLSMSEVGIFPSYKEPFGMVFVECMACGTPTIGAKSGGPTEFVSAEQGVLVEEEDDWRSEAGSKRLGKKIADQVTKAITEDWKGKKGAGCVKFVQEEFSTTAQCSAMLADMKKWD
jgi:glycosyltransferase involved in cell wall biosynthesis